MQHATRWSLSGWLASTTLATIAFWSLFGACVDASDGPDGSPGASTAGASSTVRAIVAWDPRACGEPHRVIVELDDPGGGEPIAASVPCALGEVTLDAHTGIYGGRAYAWTADATVRSLTPLVLTLDAPVTRWEVATPR